MPPRALTQFEQPYAQKVLADGTQNGWEYAAFLESISGPLIDLCTSMAPNFVTMPPKVHDAIVAKMPIVVHHNHLSQESLSSDDWHGLSNGFYETFAHCADGTTYWGSVRDTDEVLRVCNERSEINAMNIMFSIILNHSNPSISFHSHSAKVADFFRKEVLNRAMLIRGFVQYAVAWGSTPISPYLSNTCPAGSAGAFWDSIIDQAAMQLAPNL